MRRLLSFTTVLALLVFGLVATTASPASAYTERGDRAGDARSPSDTRVVTLVLNSRGSITTQLYSPTYKPGAHFNGIDIYYDTLGGSDADYRVIWSFSGDSDGYKTFTLLRVSGSRSKQVACRGFSNRIRSGSVAFEVYVPRSCLRIEKSVGIKTYAWDYTRYSAGGVPTRGAYDRAPDRGYIR